MDQNVLPPGPVTRARVQSRAHELAVIAGRVPPHVAQVDYQQAKRELTGETDIDRQDAILDSPPESKCPAAIAQANHDQMLQAARAAERKSHD